MTKPIAKQPWHPADYSEADIYAMQALAAGIASAAQQKRALEWLLYKVCGAYDETYFADSERNSAYAQGKRHVGLQIVKAINLPATAFTKMKRTNERS